MRNRPVRKAAPQHPGAVDVDNRNDPDYEPIPAATSRRPPIHPNTHTGATALPIRPVDLCLPPVATDAAFMRACSHYDSALSLDPYFGHPGLHPSHLYLPPHPALPHAPSLLHPALLAEALAASPSAASTASPSSARTVARASPSATRGGGGRGGRRRNAAADGEADYHPPPAKRAR